MAYSVQIINGSVDDAGSNLYAVSMHVIVRDGQGTEVLASDIFVNVDKAEPNIIDFVRDQLGTQIQALWDAWKLDNTVVGSNAFQGLVEDLRSTAELYVNQ